MDPENTTSAGAPVVADPPPGSPPATPAVSAPPTPSVTQAPPSVGAPAGGSTPAPASRPSGERKTLTDEQRRQRDTDRQRRHREKLAQAKGGKAAPVTPAAAGEQKPKPEKPSPGHVKKVEDALTGNIGLLASSLVVGFVHRDAPLPDEATVRRTVAPWAPLLAQHIKEDDTGKIAYVLAFGASAASVTPYVRELREWAKANPDKVKPRAATP